MSYQESMQQVGKAEHMPETELKRMYYRFQELNADHMGLNNRLSEVCAKLVDDSSGAKEGKIENTPRPTGLLPDIHDQIVGYEKHISRLTELVFKLEKLI
jgi:hypothetical protein